MKGTSFGKFRNIIPSNDMNDEMKESSTMDVPFTKGEYSSKLESLDLHPTGQTKLSNLFWCLHPGIAKHNFNEEEECKTTQYASEPYDEGFKREKSTLPVSVVLPNKEELQSDTSKSTVSESRIQEEDQKAIGAVSSSVENPELPTNTSSTEPHIGDNHSVGSDITTSTHESQKADDPGQVAEFPQDTGLQEILAGEFTEDGEAEVDNEMAPVITAKSPSISLSDILIAVVWVVVSCFILQFHKS